MRTAPPVWLLALFFTATGAAALLAEQIFERLLATVVGASTEAATIVLAVFFAGLTLGGILAARYRTRMRLPLRVYAALEAIVGGWALLIAIAFDPIQELTAALITGAGDSAVAVFWVRALIAVIWILPPTLAMGASFPALTAAVEDGPEATLSSRMTGLYAANLLGALIAVALGPYLFLPWLGLTGTLFAIAVVEFVVALLAASFVSPIASEVRGAKFEPIAATPALIQLGAVAFVSGLVFFSFEVIWANLIGAVIGTSVFAFANMLTAVILGLVLGALVTWISSRLPIPAAALPLGIVLGGGVLLLAFSGWDQVPLFLLRHGTGITGFAASEQLRFAGIAALVVPPALAMGLVFPFLFKIAYFPRAHAAAAAGLLGAANALGSIVGALVTGFVLLPAVGSEVSYRLLVLLLAVTAAVLAVHQRARRAVLGVEVAPALTFAVLLAATGLAFAASTLRGWDPRLLTSGVHVYFRAGYVGTDTQLVFWHEDTRGGFTTVARNQNRAGDTVNTLLTNGKFQGDDRFEMPAQIAFAMVPLLHQERRHQALVIGLGTGQTAHVIQAAGFARVDVAEIAPGIAAAARQHFGVVNGQVLDQPNVFLHFEDGRNHLLRDRRPQDLITIELTSVWFAGATSLYSHEFYELARERLGDHGVLQQWIQFHHIAPAEVMSALSTLRTVFDHVSLWYLGGQGVMLASMSPLQVEDGTIADLSTRRELAPARATLKDFSNREVSDVLSALLLEPADIDRLSEHARAVGIPINTDQNRFLEYSTPRHNLEPQDHASLLVRELLGFVSEDARAERAKRFGVDLGASP